MESRGQSSCRGQEDGDGSDRPLKKARFAWQVKGKHSKNETNPVITNPEGIQGTSSTVPVMEHITQTNSCVNGTSDSQGYVKNDEIKGTNAHEGPSDHKSSSSRSEYLSNHRNLDVRDVYKLNQSLSHIDDCLENQYLLEWQAQQMVACCMDNTINRIIERRMQTPWTGASLRALNMAQFLNHLPGDNTVENEGILMAISAHGLRNNTSVISKQLCDDDSDDSDDGNIPICPAVFRNLIETNEVPIPDPEPEVFDNDDDGGFFHDEPRSPIDDDHFQFISAAVQFAISSKGLTASGI